MRQSHKYSRRLKPRQPLASSSSTGKSDTHPVTHDEHEAEYKDEDNEPISTGIEGDLDDGDITDDIFHYPTHAHAHANAHAHAHEHVHAALSMAPYVTKGSLRATSFMPDQVPTRARSPINVPYESMLSSTGSSTTRWSNHSNITNVNYHRPLLQAHIIIIISSTSNINDRVTIDRSIIIVRGMSSCRYVGRFLRAR